MDVRLFKILASLTALALALAAGSNACVIIPPTVTVGPSFRVRVANGERAARGLRLHVGSTLAITDKDGIARFRGVRPGSYLLRADHDDSAFDGVNLQVRAAGPANITVPLTWPSRLPIRVRSVKGTLSSSGYLFAKAPTLSLDLLDAMSGRRLKSGESTDGGEFNFGDLKPGLYFLRVNELDVIPVEVDASAKADRLDLDLGWTDCGVSYIDRSKCARSYFQVEQLCGRISDESGSVIPDADILLYDLDDSTKLIEHTKSDDTGRFASPKSPDGSYQLTITRAGFSPLRAIVHVRSTGELTCRKPLDVKLGLMGVCSAASIH